ncbi:MAG: 5-formyltetrahydrofolate cyclo-ligase [Deltaproteobacteria bacterium]|nr:5-formyltetrahydrofolate cyclo-ligase [Deltaproteobacteria bacterium]
MNFAAKESLRRAMLDRRGALPAEFQDAAARAVEERLFSHPDWVSASRVGLYWAVRGELPTRGVFLRLNREGRSVFLPRLGAVGLEFVEAKDESALVTGAWGILEPDPRLPLVPTEGLTDILVPGVAFDLKGGRLGWGKGYYDRALIGFRGRRWALAYDFQVLVSVPTDERDEAVERIVTERRVIEVGRGA